MHEINHWKIECENGANPREYKVKLAQEIITRFHAAAAASAALENFEARFKRGAMPDEMDEVNLLTKDEGYSIANLLKDCGLTGSTSEALRMIKQGAVKIDGEKVSDTKCVIEVGTRQVFQVGKRRFARVSVETG
jgi:tyrosyl-tRNA synthetase